MGTIRMLKTRRKKRKKKKKKSVFYLRLVGQEGDVDLLQRLDELGRRRLAQLVKQLVRACWWKEEKENMSHLQVNTVCIQLC